MSQILFDCSSRYLFCTFIFFYRNLKRVLEKIASEKNLINSVCVCLTHFLLFNLYLNLLVYFFSVTISWNKLIYERVVFEMCTVWHVWCFDTILSVALNTTLNPMNWTITLKIYMNVPTSQTSCNVSNWKYDFFGDGLKSHKQCKLLTVRQFLKQCVAITFVTMKFQSSSCVRKWMET